MARHRNGKENVGEDEGSNHGSTRDYKVESLRVRLERLEHSLQEKDETIEKLLMKNNRSSYKVQDDNSKDDKPP